jgi:hypothetical protein
MVAKDKEYYRILVRDRFFKIGEIVKQAVKAKDAYRARLVELGNDLHKSTFTPDHLTTLREEARQELMQKNAALYDEFTTRVEELKLALVEAHSTLDLTNPALANALKMIELAGADLGVETIQKINAQFAFDQPALRALQAIYKARNVAYDGGLDSQVYSDSDAISSISQNGQYTLMAEGSINGLAGSIGKVAKLEGVDFETVPDPVAVGEAMRAAAGLS